MRKIFMDELLQIKQQYQSMATTAMDRATSMDGQSSIYWAKKAQLYAEWAGDNQIHTDAGSLLEQTEQHWSKKRTFPTH
jgi:hypothetical protein